MSAAVESAKPFLRVEGLGGPGEFLLSVDRAPVKIELAPAKFDAYLQEEGLEAIRAQRKARGEADKPGRERYTRHMKTLFHTGVRRVQQGMVSRAIGQPLEIVILDDDTSAGGAAKLRVRVLFEGRPLRDAQIELSQRNQRGDKSKTDASGEAVLASSASGVAILHLVHMRRCETSCSDTDWESFWSSLTFYSM